MRPRIAATTAVAALLLIAAAPVSSEGWTPTAGGWVSGPLSYEESIAFEVGTAHDATLHGDMLIVTTWRSFSIYDVSDPLSPDLLSTRPLPGYVFNEEPQTNGEILLLHRDQDPSASYLGIWDISDPEWPEPITEWRMPEREHMFTCVLDCRYAYGSTSGQIVDLSDPASPQVVGNWQEVAPIDAFHAIAEVAPGIVMTGSSPVWVLDAREDPTSPTVLARAETSTERGELFGLFPADAVPARADWPLLGERGVNGDRPARPPLEGDRFALVATETPFAGPCDPDEHPGGFATYDTRGWQGTGTFELVDEWRITENGSPSNGSAPVNVFGCSAYDFDVHPRYGEDRVVAAAWFEHGMRLLGIDDEGRIEERGGFVPSVGSASQAVWVSDDVVYVVDMYRGIDILRYTP